IVTCHPRVFGTPPNQIVAYQVYGYDDWANTPHLSDYAPFQGLDCKSPAVAAGIGLAYSSEVGNTQYTTGFYPQDYNNGPLQDVISRTIDVSTAAVGAEYVVNQSATLNMWDINRIYAVSNSSNSGKNILSALFNGTDIVYKVSANSASYKPGNTTGIIHNPGKPGVRLYPNPAAERLTITGADNSAYEILDMTGKLMLKGYNKGSSIDIRHLPGGMYVIRLQQSNKPSQTLKFTKQ
ncbi:MAG TPA: T9SS type A sorting domain-containing protein, partial [Flavipsychrobacter sp.]|nr:T9SS type A sorting domain-containing protein [Flavipsychrobacter sp.]